MPLPAATLLTSTSTWTSVPAFQYVFGRQCTSVSLSQCQVPGWRGRGGDRHVLLERRPVGDRHVEGDDHRHADADGLAGQRRDGRVGLLVEGEGLGGELRGTA